MVKPSRSSGWRPGPSHATAPGVDRVALTDGAPAHTLVLDIIYTVKYLWRAATALVGERHPERTARVRTRLLALLRGQVVAVIAGLTDALAASALTTTQRDGVATTIGYYQRSAPYMRYDQYLIHNWPIRTGAIESACGPLVKDRLEQAGTRWTTDGAHAILDLRAVLLTDDWNPCWTFHRQRQHHRLCGTSLAIPPPPEAQLVTSAAAAKLLQPAPADLGRTQIIPVSLLAPGAGVVMDRFTATFAALPIALLLLFVYGLHASTVIAVSNSTVQTAAPDAVRDRVFTTVDITWNGIRLLSLLVGASWSMRSGYGLCSGERGAARRSRAVGADAAPPRRSPTCGGLTT